MRRLIDPDAREWRLIYLGRKEVVLIWVAMLTAMATCAPPALAKNVRWNYVYPVVASHNGLSNGRRK
jgi:hypothetical protein